MARLRLRLRLWLWLLMLVITQVEQVLSDSNLNLGKNVSLLLVSRIAFGSCANQSSSQELHKIWESINNYDPQVFIWMGDNIYGDIRRPFSFFGKHRTIGPWKNVPRFVPSSPQVMTSRYHLLKSIPSYSCLRNNPNSLIIGTWDDHDYGLNDAGKELPSKFTNQQLLLDFLDEPLNSPRRKQAGVYASYTLGPPDKQIKIILLDTRFHRDPLSSDGTILGTEQWSWLENQLKDPPTTLTIIGSSIQVISNLSAMTGPMFYMESWGRFPKERARLFQLIADTKRDGVLFISGDVHFGEITRYDCALAYPLYDVTSSGLTQAVEKVVPPPLHFFVRFVAWFIPSTMRVMGQHCRYTSCTYGQPNFGVIEIDWNSNPVTVKLQVRDTDGIPVISVNVSLPELQSQSANSVSAGKDGRYQRHCTPELALPWTVRYRLAFLFSFTFSILLLAMLGVSIVAASCCRHCLKKLKLD